MVKPPLEQLSGTAGAYLFEESTTFEVATLGCCEVYKTLSLVDKLSSEFDKLIPRLVT